MRPQIDAMFKRTAPGEHRVQGSTYPTPPVSGNSTPSTNSLAAGLLSSVASQAQASGSGSGAGTPQSTSKPALIPVTSVSHFTSILLQHTAVIANFTNTPGCPPCRAIKPAYETIAEEYNSQYASRGVCFVDIELGVGEGRDLASRYGVSATPTFIFFKDGKKAEELKGADKRGLEAKVESFLEDCFPRHSHRKLYLPAIEAVPTKPIQSANAPNYTALIGKLEGNAGMAKEDVEYLKANVVPILEKKGGKSDQEVKQVYQRWTEITDRSLASLKPEETFPLIDLWRVGLLDPKITALLTMALSPASNTSEPLSAILELASSTLKASSSSTPKPFLLTVLRLITNILATPLANMILATPSQTPKLHKILENMLSVTVDSLLHPDQSVRSAAAGVAVNLAGWRHRVSKEQGKGADEGNEHDWEVELVSAAIEAIDREADEDVGKFIYLITRLYANSPAHRLLATLALSVYLSPAWESSLQGLLEVLGAKDTLEGKAKTYKKKEVRKLAEEIAWKVCT
jgi:thiol-disulfide isomerase/thioredoxin